MRPKAKAATPNTWRPRFELGVDTVILFSIPFTQVCHDPGEPVVGNVHLATGDRKGCTELYTTEWIKGIVLQRWGSVLICPSHAPSAASDVLRIHSETFCLLAFAALLNRSCSAFANRTGTILPFASPFGSLGLPTFLGFCWFATFELLSNRRPYRHCCRQNGRIQADASVLLAHESPNLIEL